MSILQVSHCRYFFLLAFLEILRALGIFSMDFFVFIHKTSAIKTVILGATGLYSKVVFHVARRFIKICSNPHIYWSSHNKSY
jgi:hypothetical protein